MSNNYEAIRPVGEHFRKLPLPEAFTWEEAIEETGPQGLYVVGFYSVRNCLADPEKLEKLIELDGAAYEEALEAGREEELLTGENPLKKYYADPEMSDEWESLSTCLWESKEVAREITRLPKHMEASSFVSPGGEGSDVYLDHVITTGQIYRTKDEELRFEDLKVRQFGRAKK